MTATVRQLFSWRERIAALEDWPDIALDDELVEAFERQALARPLPPLRFFTPSFRAYASEELEGCGKMNFPAFSVTGGRCALNCDHCQAKILEPMIPARTPEHFEAMVREMIARKGLRGFLLSGGSNRRNEVPYRRYYPVLARLKRDFPWLRIAIHSALASREDVRQMAESGVDVAMIDVIGAEETIREVYHLDRPVADFEATLAALTESGMAVVPHIVIGLHYGELRGEWTALDIIARYPVTALVLVVVTPIYAPPEKPFRAVPPREAARVFLAARERLSHLPVQLGCVRPSGAAKFELDAYATMAGLDGIAYPAPGIVALARAIGRPVSQAHACCSIALEGLRGCRGAA
jgi:uncharacterized radical SAM superfamily protein